MPKKKNIREQRFAWSKKWAGRCDNVKYLLAAAATAQQRVFAKKKGELFEHAANVQAWPPKLSSCSAVIRGWPMPWQVRQALARSRTSPHTLVMVKGTQQRRRPSSPARETRQRTSASLSRPCWRVLTSTWILLRWPAPARYGPCKGRPQSVCRLTPSLFPKTYSTKCRRHPFTLQPGMNPFISQCVHIFYHECVWPGGLCSRPCSRMGTWQWWPWSMRGRLWDPTCHPTGDPMWHPNMTLNITCNRAPKQSRSPSLRSHCSRTELSRQVAAKG
jgi:hypothetical protein